MRVWVQQGGGTHLISSGSLASVLAHVALVGSAVLGTSRAPAPAAAAPTERVYFLPPPDRMPSRQPAPERVRYLTAHGGLSSQPRQPERAGGTTPRLSDAARVAGHLGPDEAASATMPRVPAADSVYSILAADQGARVEASASPVYPSVLIEQHVEGSVQARYVIDTTGRADTSSLEIMQSTHVAFSQAVRDALPLMRFSPASVEGRRVRQMVEQDFSFRLAPAVAPVAPEHTRARPAP